MIKKEILVEVFSDIDYNKPIPFSKIKDIIQDDDFIESGWDEGFYTENNSINGHFFLIVKRMRLETNDEVKERYRKQEEFRKESKEKRYRTYLNLKKEFFYSSIIK